jgi:hypothetical protein
MSATLVWDLVDPAELVNYVRAYDNEVLFNQFTLQEYLPNTPMQELEYRIRSGTWRDVDVAKFRAWDTPAPMTGRQGMTRIFGELAPISRQIPLSEEEFLRLRELQGGPSDAIVNAIYDDAERMIRAVQGRVELARGEILTTGKITLNENGLNLQADFGPLGTHLPTAGTLWSNPAATMLSDLLTWQQVYVDDAGIPPAVMVWPRQVLSYAYLNTEMRNAAAASGTTPVRINNETVDAIFAANGLPPVVLYDTLVRVEGVATRVIPANKILMLPPAGEPLGATFYGVTAEALKMAGKGFIVAQDMPGVVAVVTETESPIQTYTLGTAVAMPVLPNPELVLCATVA